MKKRLILLMLAACLLTSGIAAAGPDGAEHDASSFWISPITDEIFARIQGKSFKDDCTLPREDLRYLHLLHTDLNGETHEGEMIVNYHIAEDVLDIFRKLYDAKYPIEKIRLVDEYDADDEASMEDNNSSSFNFRLFPIPPMCPNTGGAWLWTSIRCTILTRRSWTGKGSWSR